jgi:hypothetical protein
MYGVVVLFSGEIFLLLMVLTEFTRPGSPLATTLF